MLTKLKHWLSSLFCIHQWDIYEEHITAVYDNIETDDEVRMLLNRPPSYHIKTFVLRCTKCGYIKSCRLKF